MSDSTYDDVLENVLARLKAPPRTLVPNVESIRRKQRTPLPRAASPGWDLIDGSDEPSGNCDRKGAFTVSVVTRSDAGPLVAAPHKIEVMRRLSPLSGPAYPNGVTMKAGRIASNTETADADVTELNMEFSFTYPASIWALA